MASEDGVVTCAVCGAPIWWFDPAENSAPGLMADGWVHLGIGDNVTEGSAVHTAVPES